MSVHNGISSRPDKQGFRPVPGGTVDGGAMEPQLFEVLSHLVAHGDRVVAKS